MVKDYMKKKIAVQAMVWTGDNPEDLKQFMDDQGYYFNDEDCGLYIETLEGDHKANTGDYIIKGVKGEFYPCKPDIFEMSYEEVTEERTQNFEGVPEEKEIRGFDVAIRWLKKGKKVSRKGWNGKNMFVVYQKGYPDGIPCNKNTAEAWGMKEGELFKCEPYLQIKMVNGSHAMWVPSINDVLSNDWEIYEEE